MSAARLTRRGLIGGAAALGVLAGRSARAATPELVIGAVLPLGGPDLPVAAANLREPARAALEGLTLSAEDATQNAALFGGAVRLLTANAPQAAAERAARRLIEAEGATVLIGGFTGEDAATLAAIATETGTLFLNIAAPQDALRHDCNPQTFHVEASAAMYLDALAGWYVRAGHRRWFLIHTDDAEGSALLDRATAALDSDHWGAGVAGVAAIPPGSRDFAPALADLADSDADLVVILTDWLSQLDFLAAAEAAGLSQPVAGFPWAATQTRWFYAAARQAAPRLGLGYRAALWEPTLDAYGARELNARHAGRWGRPMDPSAWAGYQALKIAWEASLQSGSIAGRDLAARLAADGSVYDLHKGIGASFRPWDRQLRQSLYLVQVSAPQENGSELDRLRARAALTGELPAIYMPGTDPVERLDQIGDMAARGRGCG